jgi:HAD superfamily hydrolase (TIGR01490 family)
MTTAALFDFDGTLYTGHIWQDLVRHLRLTRRHRRWVFAYVARNMAPYPLYKLGLMSQETFYRAWGETMSWLIRGWTVPEAHALFEQLTSDQIVPNLRPEVLDLLRQHQEQGLWVALVSGTSLPWLEIVARRLDVDHAIGTPLVERNGRYTGQIVRPLCQGRGKPERVKVYAAQNDLEIDWANSYAYADSGTDLPLLQEVGRPVAVSPDPVLLAQAQASGWQVLGESSP